MSKPVKQLLRQEFLNRFEGVTSLAIVGFTGLDAVATNLVRGRLLEKDIRLTVVKNSLARQAFKEMHLESAGDLLDGPCAIAYGGDNVVSVVRELLDIGKEYPALTVKAAVLEGDPFAADRIEALSKYPTRDEAVARVLGGALAAGGKLAACLRAPGGKIASILKTIEENQTDQDAEAA